MIFSFSNSLTIIKSLIPKNDENKVWTDKIIHGYSSICLQIANRQFFLENLWVNFQSKFPVQRFGQRQRAKSQLKRNLES